MRYLIALCLLAVMVRPVRCEEANEPKVVDGRTWVWNANLSMYQPEGAGWNYDSDRETWWRSAPPKVNKAPVVTDSRQCPCVVGGRCVCGEVCVCLESKKTAVRVTWERPKMGDSLRRKDNDGSWWAYNPTEDVWRCCDTVTHALPLAQPFVPSPFPPGLLPMQFSVPMGGFGGGGSRGNCSS